MADGGSSVTLIFYRMQDKWWKEPWLNLVAATCQMSALTHVEIGIGEAVGQGGQIANVCRVFNDRIGVEIVERTGKNPQYEYIQLGCSKRAEQRMLHYARTKCLGRPFSNMGMARSILWPRQTDNSSFFCAELVAAILKEGGLMQQESNPGSATPEILYRLYKNRGALAGNPYVLRDMQAACGAGLQFASLGHAHPHAHEHLYAAPRASASASASASAAEQRHEEREALLTRQAVMAPMACAAAASCATCAARATSGGGAAFRQIGGGVVPRAAAAAVAAGGGATARGPAPGSSTGLNLTFNGLTMSTGASSARAHRGY